MSETQAKAIHAILTTTDPSELDDIAGFLARKFGGEPMAESIRILAKLIRAATGELTA